MLLSVYAESSSTRVGSPSRTVALTTPSPSMSGISWSTTATSGFSRRIASSAARPAAARPGRPAAPAGLGADLDPAAHRQAAALPVAEEGMVVGHHVPDPRVGG